MRLIHPLAPICDDHTHTLILGSFPSVASLQAQQYYAHPRNQFWRLLDGVINDSNAESLHEIPLYEIPYAQRAERILAQGYGVWDVIAACQREGSLDSAIQDEQPNDFAALFARYPAIHTLALNGGKAGRYRRLLESFSKRVVLLPSSSPANATHRFEHKLARWQQQLNTPLNPMRGEV